MSGYPCACEQSQSQREAGQMGLPEAPPRTHLPVPPAPPLPCTVHGVVARASGYKRQLGLGLASTHPLNPKSRSASSSGSSSPPAPAGTSVTYTRSTMNVALLLYTVTSSACTFHLPAISSSPPLALRLIIIKNADSAIKLR